MMNKSKIDWCDFTWNPVAGCRFGCPYCYAAKQAQRFSGDVRLNKGSTQLQKDENGLYILEAPFKNQSGKVVPDPVGFEPTFHKYRLPMPTQKKKPANIFVCSMADLFGSWVPDDWIEEVFKACEAAPWHNYLFLTKNPRRYTELVEKSILRSGANFWYGTTVTKPDTEFFWHDQMNTFISIEPIQAPFEALDGTESECCGIHKADWVIVGAETGNQKGKTTPEQDWIVDIAAACLKTDTPLLMKHSKELQKIWGKDLIQEFPSQLQRPEDRPIPHCLECEHHTATERHYDSAKDTTAMNHTCRYTTAAKRIPGRYARTSPTWCPLRKGE
ncbi:MAG: DUF5131 family protein [Oscillospiraceae bacterium]|nr:DUF5131 family protein [Oscillospiraceae bacterium]